MSSILVDMGRIVDEFQAVPEWEGRYKLIINRAKLLTPMDDAFKTDTYKVRGCSSTVWLHATYADGIVTFQADSDALLVRGLVALLLEVYSRRTPQQILGAPADFLEEIGLNVNLSPNRANGLTAMVTRIMAYAASFASAPKS